MKTPPRLPTQQDIAKMVGLSQVTVSDILKGGVKKKYNEDTRRKVFEIAARLNYRPHRAAQAIRGGKSGLIGMIKTVGYMETSVKRSYGAAHAICKSGYRPQIGDLVGEEGIRTVCDTMLDERVEGIIFDAPAHDHFHPHIQRLQKAGIPMVTISGDRIPGVPHVAMDLGKCIRELTLHLIRLGYRRLTLTMPEIVEKRPDSYKRSSFPERIAAFQEVTAEAGLSQAEVIYVPGMDINDEDYDIHEAGNVAAARLLDRRERPEAILCANDYWALGAFKACADRKVRVPQDIAIAGFDDTKMGKHTPSALTTVAQPSTAMAEKAVKILLSMINGEIPLTSDEVFKLPGRLIVRESCGAPAHLRTPLQPANLTEKANVQSGR